MKATIALLLSGVVLCSADHTVDPKRLDIPEIHRLDAVIKDSYLIRHDFLRCFADGEFANMTDAAAVFATNHYVYSRNFIHYLQTVAAKIESAEISKPILENINEERGNYETDDIATLTGMSIDAKWYNHIEHKKLSRRFFESLGISHDAIPVVTACEDDECEAIDPAKETPGTVFTRYMMTLYATSNVCESLAVIGFAIEETVSRLYEFIWHGLREHTPLSDADVVFFPLHILIDDGHADLLKLGFRSYLDSQPELCANAEKVVREVLEERNKMYDDVRAIIEQRQGQRCSLPYRREVESVDVDDAVKEAMRESTAMKLESDEWSLLQKMALSARILAAKGHGQTLSGQITCRSETPNRIWVNAYGKPIDVVTAADFVEIDSDLRVTKGDAALIVNKATRFHFHVYRARADIACLVHSHPPFTSALSMIGEELNVAHMDTMAFFGDVQYLRKWPGIPFGDEEGEIISAVLGEEHWAALLAHHGLIVGGVSIEQATYRAWFFEHAAQMQLRAMAAVGGDMNRIQKTEPKLSERARDWRVSEGPVKAHFNGWATIVMQQQGQPW